MIRGSSLSGMGGLLNMRPIHVNQAMSDERIGYDEDLACLVNPRSLILITFAHGLFINSIRHLQVPSNAS
jgi:hypothetical protein